MVAIRASHTQITRRTSTHWRRSTVWIEQDEHHKSKFFTSRTLSELYHLSYTHSALTCVTKAEPTLSASATQEWGIVWIFLFCASWSTEKNIYDLNF
jgi:hypothetical protein